MSTTNYIGQPVNRVDGYAKVTGRAKYAGEYNVPGLLYGFVVSSTIAKGRILRVGTDEALAINGVVQVFTHTNARRVTDSDEAFHDEAAAPGSPFRPLQDNIVKFSGQPVALVIAETFELARYAATLVRFEYAPETHETSLAAKRDQARKPMPREFLKPPVSRGDFEKAMAKAPVQIEAEYRAPREHHNPMEPFATTVVWNDGKLTIYDKTQGPRNCHGYVCRVFGLTEDDVRLLSPYVGGAFGAGLRPQYQLFLAVMAALELKRSVRVSLTRQQMFTLGRRPETIQRVELGAKKDGTLQALMHEAVAEASQYEDYSEDVVNWSGQLYRCKNVKLGYTIAPLDVSTPCDMRAPGAAWGLFALESAMDELAYELQMDPIELRLKNYAEKNPGTGQSFSSNQLRECYGQGANRFGWVKRPAATRSMRDGNQLIGWGMATGIWESWQLPASAKAILTPDNKLTVSCATADIGTGTYTIMTQIAAETMGLPLSAVTFELGDSTFPYAPVEGGSFSAATVGSAVKAVCEELRKKVQAGEGGQVEAQVSVKPDFAKLSRYTRHTHTAVFAEVKVDEDLGAIEVSRVVSAVAAGRIINPKTARSQIMGSIVWGIGMALEEESVMDRKYGRFINHNLAEYHVPVNADVHEIDVIFVEERDAVVNPLGVKGVGEPGLVGVAAAIANAVFHATGHRVRELPITLDKLLLIGAPVRDVREPAA